MAKPKTGEAKSKGSHVRSEIPPKTSNSFSMNLALSGAVLAMAILGYQIMLRMRPMTEEEAPVEHFVQIPCHEASYAVEAKDFPRCIPRIRCGRYVSDSFISLEEANRLRDFAERAMSLTSGGSGGATIFDMSSGAISHGEQFVSIWGITKTAKVLKKDDFQFFEATRDKIKQKLSQLYGIPLENFYLTKPCFFSRLTSTPAKTLNDEYWHSHVDKETYGKFIYTALIYLSTHDVDFEGGRFVFIGDGKNMTISPKKALFTTFTSGAENPHLVEPVTSGQRFALTVAFACDPTAFVKIPQWPG